MTALQTAMIEANTAGLRHAGACMWSYYTRVVQTAYDMGCAGIDISTLPITTTYRYGNIPNGGISTNYRDQRYEGGCSTAVRHDDYNREIGSAMFFAGRNKVTVTGYALPTCGSDGELCVLPIDGVELLD